MQSCKPDTKQALPTEFHRFVPKRDCGVYGNARLCSPPSLVPTDRARSAQLAWAIYPFERSHRHRKDKSFYFNMLLKILN